MNYKTHQNAQGYLKPNNPFVIIAKKLVSTLCSDIVHDTVRVDHIHGLVLLQALASLIG